MRTQEWVALVLREAEAARFWAKVSLPDANGCMLWLGRARTVDGYGQFRNRRRLVRVHRVALVYAAGPTPHSAMDAAHSCRNRHCVAPAHLRWASSAENHHDRLRDSTTNQGGRHGMSKLTETQVLKIRALSGESTGRALAKQFGISEGQVSGIINRKVWTHI